MGAVNLLGLVFLALQDGDGVRTEQTFVFQDGPEPWVFFLVILPAVVLFSVYFYRRERAPMSARARALLIGLRCLILVLVFLLIKMVQTL